MNKFFNTKIAAEIPANKMRDLYTRLEDESTPHAVVVKKCRPCVKTVVIYCNANAAGYFKSIVGPLAPVSA